MNHRSVQWLCVTAIVIAAIIAGCTGHQDVAGWVMCGLVIVGWMVLI